MAAKKRNEILFFAFRNTKLKIGLGITLFFIFLAIVGPVHLILHHLLSIGSERPHSVKMYFPNS
jgi:hypothetical protein